MSHASFAPDVSQASPRPALGPVFAALDLGTNNCRLLIARAEPGSANGGLRVLDSFSRIVRLGEGVGGESNELTEAAMERTLKALSVCRRKIEKFELAGARYVTTEACRRAENTKEFLIRAERETGLSIEVITTEEEAKLAFRGCASLLENAPNRAVIFDIGGGSTEVMWVEVDAQGQHRILDWQSLGRGVMNLAESFGGQALAEGYYDEMVAQVRGKLQAFDTKNGIAAQVASGTAQMLSTSGTVTTLAAIHLDLPRYDRGRVDGLRLSRTELTEAAARIRRMRASERFLHPCIGADRSDYIVSGCALFEAVAGLWPVERITIADRGVREGIVLGLMAEA